MRKSLIWIAGLLAAAAALVGTAALTKTIDSIPTPCLWVPAATLLGTGAVVTRVALRVNSAPAATSVPAAPLTETQRALRFRGYCWALAEEGHAAAEDTAPRSSEWLDLYRSRCESVMSLEAGTRAK